MEPVDIKIALLRTEITQAAIARKIGVAPISVSRTIKGEIASQRIRQAIADALSMDIKKIWPHAGAKPGRPMTVLP